MYENECRCQFHQHFTCNFNAHRSRKHKNDSQVIIHFALLGSMLKKAASEHVSEIDASCHEMESKIAPGEPKTRLTGFQVELREDKQSTGMKKI